MIYDITLSISYQFESPAGAIRNMLRMQPRTLAGEQVLISGLVSAEPRPDYRRDATDFFGNATTEIAYDSALTDVRFRFSGRVRRIAQVQELDLSPRLGELVDEIFAAGDVGPDGPHHFSGPSERVKSEPAITGFARDLIAPDMSVLGAVRAISGALYREMTFDPEATHVETPPAESFKNRRGVCQDFTHVMIAALRGIGIPAGYVSGFLRTEPPPGRPRLEGADAMHAWVQAWCGAETGWVQIDPTNDCLVGTDHVVVAIGRDYSDVAPVRGSIRGIGRQKTKHQVDVIPVMQDGDFL